MSCCCCCVVVSKKKNYKICCEFIYLCLSHLILFMFCLLKHNIYRAYSNGLTVLLDIHTLKDSQNGFDNSGQAMGFQWTTALNSEFTSDHTFEHCKYFFVFYFQWLINECLHPLTSEDLFVNRFH